MIAFVAIGHFKDANDALGHSDRDALLRECATRLLQGLPDGAVVAQYGGNEFVCYFPNRSHHDLNVSLTTLNNVLSMITRVEGHVLEIACSIGASEFPLDGEDAETLIAYFGERDHRFRERDRCDRVRRCAVSIVDFLASSGRVLVRARLVLEMVF